MKVVMSIGNPIKSDDNIGNVILKRIKLKNVKKIKAETTPENFIDELKKYKKIIIIDALDFKGKAGEVRVFKPEEIKDVLTSTHSIPINLLKKFLPDSEIKIIGIQPKNIEFGEELSRELKNKLDDVTKNVEKLIISL